MVNLKTPAGQALFSLLMLFAYPWSHSAAEIQDPLDSSKAPSEADFEWGSDEDKSAEHLIADAELLFKDDRPLDGRTKLLKALQKDPKQYEAHMMLAAYYMVHVGHFRLSLKYIKQAQALFEEKKGKPPYQELSDRTSHARLLYLLSQARLNLDNYQGALDTLDQFTSYDYYADWYPGSRAWVLMKLGRVDEAVNVARLGAFAGAEPGRTLNMLGILLSMKNERFAALEVFRQAITYEMSLGKLGEPATPLNNSGEVYKEIFQEDRAESAWLRATSLPDGCSHVLPSLNLAFLYMDQLKLAEAKRAIDSFESCVAQFPLKNGEEHRALVHFARGRIALYAGHLETALTHFQSAVEDRQWFGKIGASQDDLRSAVYISLAQLFTVKNNHLQFVAGLSMRQRIARWTAIRQNALRAWWYNRRAKQILIEDLSNFEDLYIRNTDSLLDYATLGTVLADLPLYALEERLAEQKKKDDRKEARSFYDVFLAGACLNHGSPERAAILLNSAVEAMRKTVDDGLKLYALSLQLQLSTAGSQDYERTASHIFSLSRPALRNHGFRLPVNYAGSDSRMTEALGRSIFFLDNTRPLESSLNYEYKDNQYVLAFSSSSGTPGNIRVKSSDLYEALNKLTDEVFSRALS